MTNIPKEIKYIILKKYSKFFIVCKDGYKYQENIESNKKNIIVTLGGFENLKKINFKKCTKITFKTNNITCDIDKYLNKIEFLQIKNVNLLNDLIVVNLKNLLYLNVNSFNTRYLYYLEKLETLILYDDYLYDNKVRKLSNLRKLSIDGKFITDYGLEKLTNLNYLKIRSLNYNIYESIFNFKNLKYLKLQFLKNTKPLKYLLNLEYLRINFCNEVNNFDIFNLINLTHLILPHDKNISDRALLKLNKLKYLNLSSNNNITDFSMRKLFRLQYLFINHNKKITINGLSNFMKNKIKVISLNRNYEFYKQIKNMYPNVVYEYNNSE